jgi:outer membrane protein assembly factor BamC
MRPLNPRHIAAARPALLIALAAALAGCSTVENFMSGDKIDYRGQSAKTQPLEIPPDLTQLAKDGRYQPQSGTVSATGFQAGSNVPSGNTPTSATVAPQAIGDIRVMRDGNTRWLVVPLLPEQIWPQLRAFWQERGFSLTTDSPEAGVMETEWAENRAKLPDDIIRRTLGRVLDSFYSTGERDKFRTRVERTSAGSEVYISHRGMEEVYVSTQRDQTAWTNRPADPALEAEFLQRLMVKLGTAEEVARSTVAGATPSGTSVASGQPARARLVPGQQATLQVDEGFDRAWRRVGLALDRGGFTVEDRDRAGGLYYVRYADPKLAGREEPGFFGKLFSWGSDKDKANLTGPGRYRIVVKGEGERSVVSVLNPEGAPENGDIGQRIVSLLVEDLK